MIISTDLDREFVEARRQKTAMVKRAAGTGTQPVERVRLPKSSMLRSHGMLSSKLADFSGMPGTSPRTDVQLSSPEIRNPLLNLINFYLPYDRKTLNQWIRYYSKFDPYVGNILDLHGEFPISDFHFTGLNDPGVQRLYDDLKERVDLMQYAFAASREYEALGEVYSFWQWDENEGSWTDYTILNPDLLDVKVINWGAGKMAVYTYDPPEELKLLVQDKDERVLDALEDLDPVVYENLMDGKRIPLDDFNVLAMVREEFAYEGRGTSPVLRALKDLMLKDKLREAQYAIADKQITPVEMWKLGDPAGNYMPNQEDLDDFRMTLEAGRHDPLYTLVTHGAVNLELVGYNGKIVDISPQMDWIGKQIGIALFVSEGMLTGGSAYASDLVSLKILQGRYQSKRDKLVRSWRKKLFEPFSLAHKIYDRSASDLSSRIRTTKKSKSDNANRPMVPGVEWNFKLDLTDQTQRLQYIMQLRQAADLPMKTVCELLDIPYEQTKEALQQEQGTVFDKVYKDVRSDKAKKSGMMPSDPGGGDVGSGAGMPAAPSGGGEAGPAEEEPDAIDFPEEDLGEAA